MEGSLRLACRRNGRGPQADERFLTAGGDADGGGQCRDQKEGNVSHAAAQLCHPSARGRSVHQAISGRSALRYLASYVCKSAFKEDRLVGYDDQGRILLRYEDSSDRKSKIEPVTPHERKRPAKRLYTRGG